MSDESSSSQVATSWQDNGKLKQVKVVVCTAGCIFIGHTYRLRQQRLLDALNKGFVTGRLQVGIDFLPLTEVEVFFPDKRKEYMASTYIRKANILFVGEKSGGQPEASDVKGSPKIYPVREKKPIGAKVSMPLHTLIGRMHGEMWHELLDTLNREEMFLPLTNVDISPEVGSGESSFDFVAVNKDRIIYVGEL